jgi:predicted secreted protein
MAEEPEVLTTTEARAGVTPHIVRYVLIISVILAVVAMVWVFATAPDATRKGSDVRAVPAASP